MKKSLYTIIVTLLLFVSSNMAQTVFIGPRLTGNLNIWNAKGLTGTWNGVGIGIGGTVDLSFSQHIGLLVNLTVFDMKNFSNSITQNNTTQETSLSLSYVTIDPCAK